MAAWKCPTFEEILALLAQVNATRALAGQSPIGVYPETKHPSHFAAHGLALEPPLLQALKQRSRQPRRYSSSASKPATCARYAASASIRWCS